MKANIELSPVDAADIIVAANNHQVWGIKKKWSEIHPMTRLPKIITWTDFLRLLFYRQKNPHRLISKIEARHLLLKIIREDMGTGRENLAALIEKTRNTIHHYAMDLADFQKYKTPMTTVFLWCAEKFNEEKRRLGLVDFADISNFNGDTIETKIHTFGFYPPTPLQQKIFQQAGACELKFSTTGQNHHLKKFQTHDDEIREAALWARNIIDDDSQKTVAVAVFDLAARQSRLRMIFDAVFDCRLAPAGEKKYAMHTHIHLDECPLGQVLLDILDLGEQIENDEIATDLFTRTAKSPDIKNAAAERDARAFANRHIGKYRRTSLKRLLKNLRDCPALGRILKTVRRKFSTRKKTLEAHLKIFVEMLDDWGFCQDRKLSADERQIFEQLQKAMSWMNRLSNHNPPVDAQTARQTLGEIFQQTTFQYSSKNARVHIFDARTVDGLAFDAAWVLNVNADFLPSKIQNPSLIPHALCQQYALEKSTYPLLMERAKSAHQRLNHLAAEMIFSVAGKDGGRKIEASPLLNFEDAVEIPPPSVPKSADSREKINDHRAKKFEKMTVRGGVKILKNQMACAFLGFSNRLKIPEIEPPHIGLNRAEQGGIIHRILADIFTEIKNRQTLISMNEEELEKFVAETIHLNLDSSGKFSTIERRRIKPLIMAFLRLEKTRDDFEVVAVESEMEAKIGKLHFKTRLDRVDKTKNGVVIFDYKTGETTTKNWCGEPLIEPQLPIYLMNRPAAGIGFIEIRAAKITYKGIAQNQDFFVEKNNKCADWTTQKTIWKKQLTNAAADFQTGKAEVLPTKNACDYCDIYPLCRVKKS